MNGLAIITGTTMKLLLFIQHFSIRCHTSLLTIIVIKLASWVISDQVIQIQ